MVLASGVAHELRTTVTPVVIAQLPAVLRLVRESGGEHLVLQRARNDGTDAAFAATLPPDWPARFDHAAAWATEVGSRLDLEVRVRDA
ncbi:hypothetical protein JSY14_09460 [Brachybacterium sp. EF45031]|uniref:hypothetical protein n=1 Tax=Brachybacterium sillae TaxID=2810536 RepID=UPI00217E4D88|nr:hypothetical protein [Brachybacterium sillae]MCS6712232.1 hypothetical protein [Brachybacterium sillae]